MWKNLDKANMFYSLGAVFILLGIIAKFLEWEAQDTLLFLGLSVEVLVFSFSSVQFKTTEKVYYWEKLFPEIATPGRTGQSSLFLNPSIQSSISEKMEQYNEQLNTTLIHFNDLQKAIHDNSNQYIIALYNMNNSIQSSVDYFDSLKREFSVVNVRANDFNRVKDSTEVLSRTANDLAVISENSKKELLKFNSAISSLSDSYQKILRDSEFIIKNLNKK
ncbi:MAG: hypothetical protein QM539_08025 [Alphaproteobacteria bacterium]|nr:hypothetical protein [Alphaproteobacteria bacterium]